MEEQGPRDELPTVEIRGRLLAGCKRKLVRFCDLQGSGLGPPIITGLWASSPNLELDPRQLKLPNGGMARGKQCLNGRLWLVRLSIITAGRGIVD